MREGGDDLPSIDTDRCGLYIARVRIVRLSALQFARQTGLIACEGIPAVGPCATGSHHTNGTARNPWPDIYLSPGETAEGHGWTTVHEAVHLLAQCSGMGLPDSSGHRTTALWGPGGVVHRAMGL